MTTRTARRAIVGRWALVLSLALPGLFLATQPAQAAPALTVTWESECGGVRSSVTSLVLAPRQLNVCGSAAPDVSATFTASNAGGTIQIRRLPRAAAVLPLKIEAVIRDPRGPASSAVAFGYDARGATSQAPESFRAALSLTGSGDATTTALNLTIAGSGPTLAVTSELFTRGPDGSRTDPRRLRLGYAPVPATATATARPAGGGWSLWLGAATPTSVTVLAENLTATSQRTLSAAVNPLPTSLALDFAGTGGGALTYTASSPVDLLTLDVVDPAGLAARATRLELVLSQVPAALSLGFAQPGAAFSLDAGAGTLGTMQALLTSGPDTELPAGEDGVKLLDTAAQYTLRAQLAGVQRVSVRQRPTIDVQVDTAGGRPFGVDLRQSQPGPEQVLLVRVPALPQDLLALSFTETASQSRQLHYSATQPVEAVTLEATNLPLAGRAKRVALDLQGLPAVPSTVTVASEASAAVDVAVDGGTIGRVQALFTSGPDAQLPAGEDAVKLVDIPAQYTLLARLTGLRRAVVRQRPSIDLQVESTGGGPFRADLRQAAAAGPDQLLVAQILNVPSILALSFAETAAGHRQLRSQSSATIGQIVLDASNLPLTGRANRVAVALQGVPTSLTLSLGAEGGALDVDTAGAALGSVEALLTSGPTEIIPAGTDGITLVDDPSRYTLAIRAAGLRQAGVTQNPLQVVLDATANRPFRLRLQQQAAAGQKLTFTDLAVDTLQRNTRLALTDTGARTELSYAAAAPATRLDLSTNSGNRQNLAFTATAPVPAALAVCFDPAGNVCGNTGRPANKGSLRVTASTQATVNLVDCRAGSCSAPDRQLRMTNLRVGKLELNLHTEPQCVPTLGCGVDGATGSAWLDTDSAVLSGDVFFEEATQAGPNATATVRFPPGFSSQNRFVTWDGPFTDSEGSINCDGTAGDGQDLDFVVEPISGITVDLDFLLC